MTPAQYIELIKKKHGFKNYRQLALTLGIDAANLVNYRKNRQNFGPDIALKVAELAGVTKEQIAVDMMAARATSEKVRRKWTAAAAVLMALNAPLFMHTTSENVPPVYYVK